MRQTRIALALALVFGGTPFSTALAQQGGATPQLPEVRVTGSSPAQEAQRKLEAEQARTPGGVTVLDGDGFVQGNVSNMTDMLRYVPGVFATSATDSESSFISIRGSNLDAIGYDMNGVKLLQDGLPVTAADGNNHNRFIDPLSARSVIVARGANALTYGASTLGGAIDFISATALNGNPREFSLTAGSHGHLRSRLSLGGVAGNLDGMVTLEGLSYDGYRDHSRHERQGIYANVGWQASDAVSTRFYLTGINSDQELPGVLTRAQFEANPRQAQAAAATNAGHYQVNVSTLRMANATNWSINKDSSLSFGLSYEEQSLYHPIVFAPPFFSLLVNTTQKNYGGTVRYNLRLGSHDVLIGINHGWVTVDGGNYQTAQGNRGAQTTAVRNRADGTELFAMDRWRFAPKWTAVYGAQAALAYREVHSTTLATAAVNNVKDDFRSLNPRAGMIHHLTPGVDLFANVSRLYEAPTTYQLQDTATGGAVALRAMRGAAIEFGSRGKHALGSSQWRWDLAYYHSRLRDEILSFDNPAAPGTSLSANFDKTTHAGVEALLAASFPLGGGARIEPLVNMTLNRFKFDGNRLYGDNQLPAAPRHALRGEILYRNASGFYAGPTFDIVGARWADLSNTYRIESYALWGLRAGLNHGNWDIFGELRNAGNKKHIAYHNVVDIAAANAALLYPGSERTVHVGARLKF